MTNMPEMDPIENRLQAAAKHFPYPSTPPMRSWVKAPRPGIGVRSARRPAWNWALAIVIALVLGGLAVPQVRAAVVEFLQVGAARIFFSEPPIPALQDSPTPIPALSDVFGQTTLAEIREEAGIPIRLPEALGPPDYVYFQENGGPLVLAVWVDHREAEVSLLALGPGAFIGKSAPAVVEETQVNGRSALWLEGQHPMFLKKGGDDFAEVSLFEAGNVLLWEQGAITYRLEGEFEMEAALRIAESLMTVK